MAEKLLKNLKKNELSLDEEKSNNAYPKVNLKLPKNRLDVTFVQTVWQRSLLKRQLPR
jgi:hypothetical protein